MSRSCHAPYPFLETDYSTRTIIVKLQSPMLKSNSIALLVLSLISISTGQLAAQESVERLYKATLFARHATELSQEQFNEKMEKEMMAHLSALPGIQGLTANLTRPGQDKAPYAAVLELWFDDADSYQAAMASSKGKEALTLLSQLTAGEPQIMPVYEAKMIYPPTTEKGSFDGYKRVYVAYHNPEITQEEYMLRHLRDYAPIANGLPGFEGYVLNFAMEDDFSLPAHVIVHSYFKNAEVFKKAMQEPNVKIVSKLIQPLFGESLQYMEVKEHVVIPPPRFALR